MYVCLCMHEKRKKKSRLLEEEIAFENGRGMCTRSPWKLDF